MSVEVTITIYSEFVNRSILFVKDNLPPTIERDNLIRLLEGSLNEKMPHTDRIIDYVSPLGVCSTCGRHVKDHAIYNQEDEYKILCNAKVVRARVNNVSA